MPPEVLKKFAPPGCYSLGAKLPENLKSKHHAKMAEEYLKAAHGLLDSGHQAPNALGLASVHSNLAIYYLSVEGAK